VRKLRSPLQITLTALFTLCLSGLLAYAQDQDRGRVGDETPAHPRGIVQDWSHHHVVYPRLGSIPSLLSLEHDPRAMQSWRDSQFKFIARFRSIPHGRRLTAGLHHDWSIALGNGSTAPNIYPAKFGFSPTASAECTNDYVVFPVDVAGGLAQPNLVGFNNLYSGTTPSAGICNAPLFGRTAGPNDDGVSATTIFSYNVTAAGGIVATSPALSLDGAKIAFVETGAGTTAHFHVLAWKSGDGVAANLQFPAASPKQLTSSFAALAPVAGSGTVTDLVLNVGTTQSDTLSSPFVDYDHDVAYVGNDSGQLFKIRNVFCPAGSSCASGSTPAPSLDPTWGTGGALSTACAGKLTGPVVEKSGNILVGCSDGKLYGFTPGGVALTALVVGNGSATGGIVDPPVVDEVNGFVYAVSGNNGTNAVVVQAKSADLSSAVTATLDPGGVFNLHAPALNEAYFASLTSTNWLLYEFSANTVANSITIWGVGFGAGHVMNSGTPTAFKAFIGFGTFEISPLTEFFNGGTDFLYVSDITSGGGGAIDEDIISPTFLPLGNATASATEGSGTSGIVVDNVSGSSQASSIYFGVLGAAGLNGNSAVKLTQAGLN
jgi:hypothetical protein